MLTKGALLGTMSGSIGGATASRNRGGQYFRQRVVPTNPNSSRQQAVRGIFAGLVAGWISELTSAQRAAWKTYADNVPFTNALGDQVTLTGQQIYIGANTARKQAGLTDALVAPTTFDRGESVVRLEDGVGNAENTIDIVGDATVLSALLSAGASDDGDALLFIGEPQNPTINYFKGPYQFAGVVAVASAATSADFSSLVASTLPINTPLAENQRRPVRVVMVYDDGRYTAGYEAICTIVDTTV